MKNWEWNVSEYLEGALILILGSVELFMPI